ncbi:disgorgin [Novymonas esmeraldas]|uniref:Disgorgin n=1 Tax=Novymonas esmeraldas TaxID=1808958 RepID=A0AAW0F5Z5_9TRYP
MDEGSVFVGGDEGESAPRDLVESTSLHISAVRADRHAAAAAAKPAVARDGGRNRDDVLSTHTATAAGVVNGDTAGSLLNAPERHASHSSQSHSATSVKKSTSSPNAPGSARHAVVELVTSPLRVAASDEEVKLEHAHSSVHEPPVAVSAAAAASAVQPSVTSRPTPLIPEHRQVVKGAALPQPLRKSQLRAAPTGGSDSDTEEDGVCNTVEGPDADSRHSHVGNDSVIDVEEREAEQQFVDEFGFVIDEGAKDKDERYIRRIDGKQVVRREVKWANMASDWNRTNTKMHAKLKERCRKGIPSRFRGVAWQLLMGSFHQLGSEENNGVYVALRDKRLADKEVDAIISRDLARTFPTHVLFQDAGGVGQTFLRNVLHAYAGCDPEVGYVQGMGFLVAALSTQVGEEESFWALHEMMYNERYKMRELFRPGFPLLQQFFYQLKRLIARLLPRLSKRLDELEIQPSFFASQWFLTLFVAHFPFRALLRVWDIFFSEGWKIVFRTGIALMKWEEAHLLTLPFEEMLPALKGLQDGKDARELLRRAHRVKFKTAELNRYGDEYWEMVGVIHRD